MEENTIQEQQDFTIESLQYYDKIKRKVITSAISFGVIAFTLLFRRYRDFDVALSSIIFNLLLVVAIILTGYAFMRIIKTKTTLEYERTKKELKRLNDIYEVIAVVPLFVAIITFLNAFIISPASVVMTSMEPNYYEGDNILVYHLNVDYERFDVVIVSEEEDYFIKRIIGMPGETITIKDGNIYIDDVLLDDPTVLKPGAETYCKVGYNVDTLEECSWTIPQGEYFVIGDNREGSRDSRYYGTFEEYDLYGKVVFKFKLFN